MSPPLSKRQRLARILGFTSYGLAVLGFVIFVVLFIVWTRARYGEVWEHPVIVAGLTMVGVGATAGVLAIVALVLRNWATPFPQERAHVWPSVTGLSVGPAGGFFALMVVFAIGMSPGPWDYGHNGIEDGPQSCRDNHVRITILAERGTTQLEARALDGDPVLVSSASVNGVELLNGTLEAGRGGSRAKLADEELQVQEVRVSYISGPSLSILLKCSW